MPRTYSCIHLHIIFATKTRRPWLDGSLRERTHAFLGGIVRDLGATPVAIGGVEDHVHALVRWRTDKDVASLVREAKARSSRWLRAEIGKREFSWQEGYSVFSVSRSHIDAVARYIRNQKEHHRHRTFKEELVELLERHDVDWHPDYTFD